MFDSESESSQSPDFDITEASVSKRLPMSKRPAFSYPIQLQEFSNHFPTCTSPEDIFSVAHSYFSECFDQDSFPTSSGLAFRLGMDRAELLDLKRKNSPEGKALRMAIAIIIDQVERDLLTLPSGQVGRIFWLKNMDDWVDKSEIISTKKSMKDFLEELKQQSIPGQIVDSSSLSAPL